MNSVYVRLIIYVFSILLGMIPAGWAGWVSFDEATQMLQVSVPGLATAIVTALGLTSAVFARWGSK